MADFDISGVFKISYFSRGCHLPVYDDHGTGIFFFKDNLMFLVFFIALFIIPLQLSYKFKYHLCPLYIFHMLCKLAGIISSIMTVLFILHRLWMAASTVIWRKIHQKLE